MPVNAFVFFVCQAVAAGYALLRGGLPERIVAIELTVAAIAGEVLAITQGWTFARVEWPGLLLDTALFGALLPVAIRANRYWPLWLVAVQLDTIAMHGVRAFDPTLRPSVYFVMAGYTAYPILILLALGTLRHHDRVARTGHREAAWVT